MRVFQENFIDEQSGGIRETRSCLRHAARIQGSVLGSASRLAAWPQGGEVGRMCRVGLGQGWAGSPRLGTTGYKALRAAQTALAASSWPGRLCPAWPQHARPLRGAQGGAQGPRSGPAPVALRPAGPKAGPLGGRRTLEDTQRPLTDWASTNKYTK